MARPIAGLTVLIDMGRPVLSDDPAQGPAGIALALVALVVSDPEIRPLLGVRVIVRQVPVGRIGLNRSAALTAKHIAELDGFGPLLA